jgi:rhamnosyltransferase
MTEKSVCAVIVTYHPSAAMIEGLKDQLAQAQGLVVVDNGSNADEVGWLRDASLRLSFHLIENRENLGVAAALNVGIKSALDRGFDWVVTFDQDSKIADGFMSQMFGALESHPEGQRVGSMHPRYLNQETGVESKVRRAPDDGPIVSMTSGALMPAWIFHKIGWFATEYFIDQVDFEYCLRIRAAGYLVADAKQAILLHHAGQPKKISFLGFSFAPTNHSVSRRYYMSRNRIALYRKYFRTFPGWVLGLAYDSLRETVKCFVSEQDRLRKLRSFVIGTWDGLTDKMGKREEL